MSDFARTDDRLDAIRVELSAIQLRLLELPEDAFGDRLDLRQRQAELRRESRQLSADSSHAESDTAVREHLQSLRRELSERLGGRISHTAAAQTGRGGGIDPGLVHDMNRRIDKGRGVDALRRQISALERRLAGMTSDGD
jgi:hypothetical protein